MRRSLLFILFLINSAHFIYAQEKSNPTFSGLMFGDYFYNAASHDSAAKDLNGFQFRRIYITTDYTISNSFSTRFRLDADQSKGSLTNGGKIGVVVKDAWLKWKDIFSGSDFIFGISPTPSYSASESAWGHRYLEKTIMNLFDIVSTRDFGVDLKGKLSQDSTFKYWLKIGNNSSNSPENNKYKRFYGLLEFDPSPELIFTIYGDYAAQPQKEGKNNDALVGAGFINYKQKGKFSIGIEGFIKSQRNNYPVTDSSLVAQTGFGLSIYAYVNLSDKFQIVGRFDIYDQNTNSNSNTDGINFILAGFQYSPIEYVSITPNIEIFTYQADSSNNGDRNDIIPRITFFWQF